MRDPTASPDRQALARQRAQLIMQVRSGVLTAEAAARQLDVSRKTYYKWERRALAAMVEALGNRGQGAPAAAERSGEGGPPAPDGGAPGEAHGPGADGAAPAVAGAAG
jgi:hypothetical protein